ncbi:ChaC-like protein [Atractiella rhizophila]|nr:ChaC-like protein [Atractiella rhizophila]
MYVYGYGSLIWKPPPHTIERIPGYVKGFVRRFAQKSHDHRGVPGAPGRVVTLLTADDWKTVSQNDEHLRSSEECIVWGVAYLIDPAYEKEVFAYLDHREKDGYTLRNVDLYGPSEDGTGERVLVSKAMTYVGELSNPSFAGYEKLSLVAETVHRSVGPSGPNQEYLFKLVESIAELAPESEDTYLMEMVQRVKELDEINGRVKI